MGAADQGEQVGGRCHDCQCSPSERMPLLFDNHQMFAASSGPPRCTCRLLHFDACKLFDICPHPPSQSADSGPLVSKKGDGAEPHGEGIDGRRPDLQAHRRRSRGHHLAGALYKSTCCCKCVSTRWRDLFSHPDHRKKLPQTLAGFFHEGYSKNRFPSTCHYFTNVSGEGEPLVDPSLSFLPRYDCLDILDCCNGLLLCRCWKATDPKTLDYVVCNPATEIWVVVPATEWSSKVNVARLGLEPTVSSHFHVFEFIDEEVWGIEESERSYCDERIETVAIYSSKAGVWKHQSLDSLAFAIPTNSKSVFLNGILHLAVTYYFILAVDVEENDWRIIHIPMEPYYDDARDDAIFVSRGQLYFTSSATGSDGFELSVWAHENYNSERWTLKHNVSALDLFGAQYSLFANHFNVISFHPECNMIFIVCGHENTLMAYEMGCRKLCFICELGRDCQIEWGKTPYIPYVPLYSQPLADVH